MAVVSREVEEHAPSNSGETSLQAYLTQLERDHPEWVVHVTEPVEPAKFEVTAVLQQLELRDQYPLVIFDRPLNLLGEV